MLAVLFALVAAVSYGSSDFVGGLLSKSRSSWTVAVVSQLVAAVVTAVVALFLYGEPHAADFAWAAAGGVGEAVGIAALYHGLAQGRMGVVAPISGTGATLVPVAVGVLTGDEPSALAWLGIALAFPAVYLIPRSPARTGNAGAERNSSAPRGILIGIMAGLGFGAQFALVGQIDPRAGLFPLSVLWVVSALTVAVAAVILRQRWWPRTHDGLLPVVAFGPVGAGAVIFFLLATGQGLLTLVSVIAALYPAITVALAAFILREKIGRLQATGLALAAATVVLVTVGR